MDRKILHVDQNCFFASVEMKNNPQLRDVPMAVCGDQEQRHGIVLTKNALAKKAGIHTGEVIWQAKQRCPGLVIVNAHYESYSYYSQKAFEMYCQYTDRVEPFGIDECWLDLTDISGIGDIRDTADEIRRRVKNELGLTCSVGASFNKVFAKLGSDYKKPDATTLITKENFRDIVWPLPVGDLLYAGHSTQKRLSRININTIGELAALPPAYIESYLGKNGAALWIFANGLDESPVHLATDQRIIKSVGNSATTSRDMICEADVWQTIVSLSDQVAARLRRYRLIGYTIQIWVRDSALKGFQRQQHLHVPTNHDVEIARIAMDLFRRNYTWEKGVRSLGVRVMQVISADVCRQISIFDPDYQFNENAAVAKVMDTIRLRFGEQAIFRGVLLDARTDLLPEGQFGWNQGGFKRSMND